MQNAWDGNPPREDQGDPIPGHVVLTWRKISRHNRRKQMDPSRVFTIEHS
jgi:predicted alpha/beta hydrolase